MPAQVTTRAQVNGYRFLIRRLEHALIRGDSRMIHDPMRGQMRALMVGMVISILIAGAAGVLAFFKPAPNFGNASIFLSKSNGTAFVKIGEKVHPVLNMASARLITGKPDEPKQVDDKFLNTLPLGPLVGIIGAPTGIHASDDRNLSSWTVCDNTGTPKVSEPTGAGRIETTVLANNPVLTDDIREAMPAQSLLTKVGDTTFLVYEGKRAVIDTSDPVIATALHLAGSPVRQMSPGLLNAFPLVDPILPVKIPGVRDRTDYLGPRYPVGSIVKTVDSTGEQFYVVLAGGLQPVSRATADIIRYSDDESPTLDEPETIPPALLSSVPVVDVLHVDHYPSAPPQFIATDPDRVVCLSWAKSNTAAEAKTRMLVGHRLPIPENAQPVRLATADGSGPGLDGVYLRPGTGEWVQATGGEPDSAAIGQQFYVSDIGLRFHLKDLQTAAALGTVGPKDPDGSDAQVPLPAPWPILSLLPAGPELSQAAALVAHDGMAADPAGEKINLPK